MRIIAAFILLVGFGSSSVLYANETVDAAVGGGIGGAIGGAVGSELGGRNGAIVGAGVGAAAGAAIATNDDSKHDAEPAIVVVPVKPTGNFCPPGQAKKGRC